MKTETYKNTGTKFRFGDDSERSKVHRNRLTLAPDLWTWRTSLQHVPTKEELPKVLWVLMYNGFCRRCSAGIDWRTDVSGDTVVAWTTEHLERGIDGITKKVRPKDPF